MKGGLYVIYTSLLTISVLSSCALFIIVVSESLQEDGEVNVDLSGLHNVSKNIREDYDKNVPKNDEVTKEKNDPQKKPLLGDTEMTFADALSLNSVTTDGNPLQTIVIGRQVCCQIKCK